MGKYRKKTVEIEAFKWTGDINQTEDPIWIIEAIKKGIVWFAEDSVNGKREMIIRTLKGNHRAQRGDYIIKGVNGEIYPCKPDIFEINYENSCKESVLVVVTDSGEIKVPIADEHTLSNCIYIIEEGVFSIADKIFINERNFKYCYIEDEITRQPLLTFEGNRLIGKINTLNW